MSATKVPVVEIESVLDHPKADKLAVAVVNGYHSIVGKLADGSACVKSGDYVVYIPEGYVVPQYLMERLDLWDNDKQEGKLGTEHKNVVRAIRLRGILSQGLILPLEDMMLELPSGEKVKVNPGDDVSELLGVFKYRAPIPEGMEGEVVPVTCTKSLDFENINVCPSMFSPDDMVWVSEKIHGTQAIITLDTTLNDPSLLYNNLSITSKSLADRGLVFADHNEHEEVNKGNLYQNMLRKLCDQGLHVGLSNTLLTYSARTVSLFGEIYGGSVQDLKYGRTEPDFVVFDMKIDGEFLPFSKLSILLSVFEYLNLPPTLYVGKYDLEEITKHRDGMSKVPRADNIREGLVIREIGSTRDPITFDRKIAKMVSPDYLLRREKKGVPLTEHQ